MNFGYIYIRQNEYWDLYHAFKLGKTTNIPDREQTYITSEIKRGNYVIIIEIDLIILDDIEKKLQIYFNKLNLSVKFNAGTEFYKKEIINFIIPYFDNNNIEYKILSENEINKLIRKIKNNDNITINLNMENIEEKFENVKLNNDIYIPRKYQEIIIRKSCEYFKLNEKGLLIIPCGVGKTLISLWITKELNSNTILIGVPNKLLLKQWENVICNLFQNIPYLIITGGVSIESIIEFLENNKEKCIVITTYASSYKVYNAIEQINFIFNIKINDEVHHLTSFNIEEEEEQRKTFINMLKIKSEKQLSLTATLKLLENNENERDDNIIISNDNIEYFGEIIDRKTLLWAISENIICDYVIQTIITNEENLEKEFLKFNIFEETDKRLFLSAFATLKSIFDGHSHHLLIYSNNKYNSLKLIQYIKILLENNYFDISELYYSNYHSDMNSKNQKEIINNYEKSKFGIITCVYCLSEGYDNHNIDAVVFSENMSSNIRIVQSSLRASRKNKFEPNKITKIILPILNKDDWLENNDNSDLKKVREIIYQMGLEDETIAQKIKVYKIDIEKEKSRGNIKKDINNNFGYYEDEDELTKKIILKTIKRIELSITYEKAKKIIHDKNIKSKESYYELCKKDNRLITEPEIVFKSRFTNWIEYLGIERIYYDFETCKNKVNEYLLLYPEIEKYYLNLSIVSNKLCKIDSLFPPYDLWVEYYNIKDLRDIIIIKNKKKKIGAIL